MIKAINTIRWVLTIPAALSSVVIVSLLFVRFFGIRQTVSAAYGSTIYTCGIGAATACLFVLLPTLMAPAKKLDVALAAYLFGLVCVGAIHYLIAEPYLFSASAISGGVTLMLIKPFLKE